MPYMSLKKLKQYHNNNTMRFSWGKKFLYPWQSEKSLVLNKLRV